MRIRAYVVPLLLVAVLAALPLVGLPNYLASRFVDFFLFAVLALSYDLLIGVTGIVSFGHALFYGAGAYVLAIFLGKLHAPLYVALPAAIIFAGALAALVGALSLRVRGHFFAMITLAFAEVGHVIVQKWSEVTGGADGLSVRVPSWFISVAGQPNRVHSYWVALGLMVVAYLIVRRMVDSPVGRVWQAIRENEFRASALGFNVTGYKVAAMVAAGVIAGAAGAGVALLAQQGATPEWLTSEVTIQALLMTIIGGVGTLHGAMLGAVLVRSLSYWLAGLHDVSVIFAHWPLLFGLIYVAIVMFLPAGIVGTYRNKLQGLLTRALPQAVSGRQNKR